MNAPLTNVMTPLPTPTPKRSARVPAGRKAPEKPSLKRVANKSAENPKSNSRPAAGDKGGVRPKISAKAARKNSGANHRAAGRSRKGSNGDKIGKQVALAAPSLAATGLDTQVNVEANPAGSTAVFATILQATRQPGKQAAQQPGKQAAQQPGKQAARQLGKTLTLDAVKTKAVVPVVRKATPGLAPEGNGPAPEGNGPAPEGKVTVQELASARTAAQPSTVEKTASPVVTVPADRGVLRKALAPVVPAKVRPGEPETAEKDASPATPTGKNRVIAPKAAITPGPAAQVSDQIRRTIQPEVTRGSEILKQSSLPSVQIQSAVSAANKLERPAKPNPGPAARNKVTLQTDSAQQAKVTVSAAQGIPAKRLSTLSHAGDTAPGDTVAAEAVRPRVLSASLPDVARASEILKQSWLASMQGPVSAANKTGRPGKPNPGPGPAARGKVTLQTDSAQQAKVTVPAAQGILAKQLGTLSPGADRQARFVVKELTGTGRNGIAGETAPVYTAATEAVRPGVLAPGSPVNQIAEAFRSSAARNGQEIVIRLNPPELGRVCVMLRVEGNEVRGVLDVENPRTLSQLQREVPNIMSRLTDAGIEMKRMDLSLNENATRDSMRDSSWFSQQYGENGPGHGGWDAPRQWRATDETLPGGPEAEGELPPALMTIGSDSINIWI